jgi:hypothetical protein
MREVEQWENYSSIQLCCWRIYIDKLSVIIYEYDSMSVVVCASLF